MRGRTRKNILAVIIGEKSIAFCEGHANGGEHDSSSSAILPLPADFKWESPGDLGVQIKALLRDKKMQVRSAIICLPSRWVLTKPMALPPTNRASAAGILRLAIEREFQGDAKDWVFDYAGEPSTKDKCSVLLTATPRTKLALVMKVMEDAGVKVEAVTATMIELAAVSSNVVLFLSPDGTELAVSTARGPTLLQRLNSGIAQPDVLVGEVRRSLGAVGIAPASLEGMQIISAVPSTPEALRGVMSSLGIRADSTYSEHADFSPGEVARRIALQACNSPSNPRINFQNSKLAEEPTRWLTRPRAGALAAAAILTIILLYLVVDWYSEKLAVDDLQENLAAMRTTIGKARANVDQMTYARKWFDARPAILDCAREVTLAFPTSGQAWTTNLTVKDDLTGTLAGRAQTEKNALELLDRIRGSKRFSDVKLLYLRQADRTSKVVAFGLTFTYSDKE